MNQAVLPCNSAIGGRLRGAAVTLHTMLLQLALLLVATTAAQQTGKQNTGGGLVGEIFGAGGPGAGGNGMEHAWDGQTSTWFDCLAPPEDFWDNCYTGIKLLTPTAIGQIRFCKRRTAAFIQPRARRCTFPLGRGCLLTEWFADPRGVCPGCQYAGPGKPANPACEGEHNNHGACRMVGGRFEGATATAPEVWNTLATIQTRPSEDAWGSLESSDSTPYTCEFHVSRTPATVCSPAHSCVTVCHSAR